MELAFERTLEAFKFVDTLPLGGSCTMILLAGADDVLRRDPYHRTARIVKVLKEPMENQDRFQLTGQYLKSLPGEPLLYYLRGCSAGFLEQWSDSIYYLKRYAELCPTDKSALYLLGVSHYFEGQNALAEMYFLEYLASVPRSERKVPETLFFLASLKASSLESYWRRAEAALLVRLPCWEPVNLPFVDMARSMKAFPPFNELVDCHFCGTPATPLCCSKCQWSHCCNVKCQRDDWPLHKTICALRSKRQ